MQQVEDATYLPEPTSQVARVVVQHNALAEAHYRLSLRAQKLLIRLIAELDQQSVELSEVTLSLADFAVLAAQDLLGLKRTFFVYRTLYAFNLGSAYGIRLYQWAKSREYLKRPQQVTVDELRLSLGTIEFDGRGKIVKESLRRYADFNRVALQPAMKEINEKTDISLAFREVKRPGTKIVAAIVFTVRQKEPSTPKLKGFEISMPSQFELFQGRRPISDHSDPENLLKYIEETYQLNEDQRKKVDGYIKSKGFEYVREKITLTELEPRENIARFLWRRFAMTSKCRFEVQQGRRN
jgi:hypothetical protein